MDGAGLARAAVAALAATLATRGALAGCDGAAAAPEEALPTGPEPAHGIDVPAAWTEQPSIAEAAEAAARAALPDGAAAHAHAWAEPALGCYLAIVEVHGGGRITPPEFVERLQASLPDLALADWSAAADAEDQAAIDLRFATTVPRADGGDRPMAGRARVLLTLDRRRGGHAVAAACFYNDRYPAACDDACAPLLSMLAPLPLPRGP